MDKRLKAPSSVAERWYKEGFSPKEGGDRFGKEDIGLGQRSGVIQ